MKSARYSRTGKNWSNSDRTTEMPAAVTRANNDTDFAFVIDLAIEIKNAMERTKRQKQSDAAMMAHRKWRCDAVEKIAASYSGEMAMRFERNAPVCFDVQVDPDIARAFVIPPVRKFHFFIYQN